ncbi:MAG: serine/threonine protein kinase [Pyrinomonadaceae bacterium]
MSDQFIGQTLADKYRIDSVLRHNGGGLGTLYSATHLLMDKPVTTKILAPALAVDAQIVKSFAAEARAVSHIAHPNILNATDFGTDKSGAAYIVFEGAESGEILEDAIKREGKFSFDRAVRIARQIAAALSAAHAFDIVHGNLNPENVLLTKSASGAEIAKVLDFGAALENEADLANGETYRKNLEYLSPEQNSSVAEADRRSDIYSLGVIFYEMLAGETPYSADTPTELLTKQAENPPAPLSAFRSDLTANVEPVILKALAKNPEMRYQNAQEFVADLNRVANDSGDAETIIIPKNDLSDNAKNNLWKTAFVVLAGIALLAVGLIYATSSKQTNPPTALQTDANGQPVQPLNPPTGMNELGAANLMNYPAQTLGNSNMFVPPSSSANPNSDGYGDGYNPWARGVPPPGAPVYVPPGGQTIDPTNPNSIFMQDGTVLVPVPTNSNANVKPAATPIGKPTPTNANSAVKPTPTPAATPQPSPAKTPAPTVPKPSPQPTKNQPAATEKRAQSGKEQNS